MFHGEDRMCYSWDTKLFPYAAATFPSLLPGTEHWGKPNPYVPSQTSTAQIYFNTQPFTAILLIF